MSCPEIPGDSPDQLEDSSEGRGDLLDLPADLIVIVPDGFDPDETEDGDELVGDAVATEGQAPRPPESGVSQPGIREAPEPGAGRRARPPLVSRKRLARLAALSVSVIALATAITLVSFTLQQDYLSAYFPSPGRLSAAHAEIGDRGSELQGDCFTCHEPGGMADGCLRCHEEIWTQLARRRGFHDFLLHDKERECARCHLEHLGRENHLVSALSWAGLDRENFTHPHVEFTLEGKHGELDCADCHVKKLKKAFTLPRFPSRPREHTHLGLAQDCVSCHEDIHSHGLSSDCASCHGQDAFRPATHFDHDRFFPLLGGHERVECAGCHEIPDRTADASALLHPFDKVRGTRCVDCHESPHRTWSGQACETCHTELLPEWISARETMTAELHALTGFPLDPPHEQVACEGCHEGGLSYPESHPDPSLPGYLRSNDSCQGCHEDEHGGQFTETHPGCLDCHDRLAFQPHHFDLGRHESVYPLVGAHAEADCSGCHLEDEKTGVRRFVGTTQECKSCHEDPHAGQFDREQKACADCHDTWRFKPSDFSLQRHTPVFPLSAPHSAVPCTDCHTAAPDTGVRVFTTTSRECKGCHENPHGDQFADSLAAGDCSTCHDDMAGSFAILDFDHTASTTYPLLGAHADAQCNQCHRETSSPGASGDSGPVRIFQGTSRECGSCHVDVHRGQFLKDSKTLCTSCHLSTSQWRETVFDHNTQSRFPLDGEHVGVPCDRCHPRVRLPDGGDLLQFKPLGTECNDCHEVPGGEAARQASARLDRVPGGPERS